jgi:hypothetical protein
MKTKQPRKGREVLTDTEPVETPATSDTIVPPEMDPMLGDKTPAYVEWLRDNAPVEFQRRYAGRRTHLGFTPAE